MARRQRPRGAPFSRVAAALPLAVLALGLGAASASAQAPGWDATFVVDPFPPAYLSDWETNPTVATLTVTNGTASDADVTIHFSITDGGGSTVIQGRSDPQWVPAGTPTMFSTTSTIDGTSSYDPAIEDVIVRTGRFPEGDYTACVTLTDQSGLVVADNLCAFFSSYAPDPPYLLFPADEDTVSIQDPIFEWTPVQVPVTVQPRYVVQVAEILPGQTPYEALTSRIPHYEDPGQFMPAFQYPLGAQPFNQGQDYAWWVQALDPSGYPLSTNQGRSEVWSFTYWSEDEGGSSGPEVGSDVALIPMSAGGSAADVVDLRSSTYEAARDQLGDSPSGSRIRLPLPDVDFVPLELWNVRVEADDAQRALAIGATASLPHSSVDLLLLATWQDDGTATFALGLDPVALSLAEWIEGLDGTPLAELDFGDAVLTLASAEGTLDAAQLPPSVGDFYGAQTIELVEGVSVRNVVDLSGTTFAERLSDLGIEAGRVELTGALGIDASALFDEATPAEAPTLDLRAALDVDSWGGLPEWLELREAALRLTNDPELAMRAEAEVGVDVADTSLDFLLQAEVTANAGDEPVVFTGRSLDPWDSPLGLDWLALDSALLTVTPPADVAGTLVASLEGWVTAGEQTVSLVADLEGLGEDAEVTLTATVPELAVADLVALLGPRIDESALGGQLPGNLPALRDVAFELRSGDPATFTVSATATAFGQSTDFLYTLVPSDIAEGSLIALRLGDWSLADLLPSLRGNPFGDLRFPEVSFVIGPTPGPLPPPDPDDPEDPDDPGGRRVSIPWGRLPGLARDFLQPTWPCASGATGCNSRPPEDPEENELSLRPGLNFSAPISLAQLSAAFSGLFDIGPVPLCAGCPAPPPDDPGNNVVIQGSPGVSLWDLLNGDFDITALLDLIGRLPPLPEVPFGWPDWLRPGERSIRVFSDPEVSVEASVQLVADLDGEKVFDLTGAATNAGGGGAELDGVMRGTWDQPFGLEWLALDSVHIGFAAGSVGPRVALGAGIEVGTTTAAADIDVRGTSDDRSLDFRALARNLSTADLATFLNEAFDADVAVPANPIALDSLTVAFSTGDSESVDVTGAFASGMDAAEVMVALAELLPGVEAPSDVPFSLGTLASAWFELHAVPDSIWGAYGGAVEVGEAGGPAFVGTAAVRMGATAAGGDEWVALEMDLGASDLSATDALAAIGGAVEGGWTVPEAFDAATDVTLDEARLLVGLDSRSDSASVDLSGTGRIEDGAATFDATAALRLFDVADSTWADGSLSILLRDVSVTQSLQRAASLLPGDWSLPDDLDALAPIQLDSASLAVGFDSRADSVSANVGGTGTMGGQSLAVTTSLSVVQAATESWGAGTLDVRIEDVALPDALGQVALILPGDWTLPSNMSGLSPIVVDTASLVLAFDTRDGTFSALLNGGSHMGDGAGRLDGTTDLQVTTVADERVVEGQVTLGVADLDLNAVLGQTGELLPGDWTLPDGFTGFDALALDSALLDVGFSTRTDSLGASMRGLGRLSDGGGDVGASAALELSVVGDRSGASGAVELVATNLSTSEALERIAAMLPGEWTMPDGLEAFDAITLDSAGFVIGFDTWADSVFAGVAGTGRFDDLTADARLDFARMPSGDRASGLVTMDLGAVGAAEAIESIGDLLPGDWALPDGFSSFDALELDRASLQAGFDTRGDSLWAGFEGAGRLDQRQADARLGFSRIGDASYGNGRLGLSLGDVSLDEAFAEVSGLLPGEWSTPAVDFDLGELQNVVLEAGFDTRVDSLWAGVEAGATLAQRDGLATLYVVSRGGAGGAAESFVIGTFRVDVGDITLTDALDLAVSLVPSAPAVPDLGFDLGGLSDAVLEAGFRIGASDSTWAGLSGGFALGGLTGRADVGLALGQEEPSGRLTAAFDDSFSVPDVVSLMTGFLPGGGIELPPLGPLDVALDDPLLTLDFGQRNGLSLGGSSQLFGKAGDALFSMAQIDGRPQLIFGVQVPDLGFTDILPDFSNPVTDALRLDLAALTLTRAEGTVEDEELTEAERGFFRPLAGGSDDFSVDFRPGLNLTGLIPLADGAMKDMVDMLSPGAGSLMMQGTIPLPGFGSLRDLALQAELPPMAPPGSPAWFVEGEIGVQITGRPSVGVAGALTVDVDGDTLTFDIESNVAIVPAGVELSIAGGLAAANPWVGPLGVDWLTLNEIRLALGLSPVAVRLGFLGDAAFGEKSFRVALGTKINLYTGAPIGLLVLGEAPEGMSLGELADFQRQVAGPDAAPLPTEALPDMAVRELGIRVATYTDFDLGVEAGIGFRGAFLIQTSRGGPLSEFGRVELSIDPDGIIGYGSLGAFSLGPVHFDDALFDLALTVPDQHLIIEGGVTIDNAFSADVALAMSRDSLRFSTDYMLFDAFRTDLDVRAGFSLTNPTFAVHGALYPEFSDEVMISVIEDLLPVGRTSLDAATLTLQAATTTLNSAEQTLDDAVWAAGEAARLAMNAAYSTYQYAASRYSTANSNYRYYASRCSWRRPLDCSRASYWRGVRSYWSAQRSVAYAAYLAARAVYLNQEFLENNPVVDAARDALAEARASFNAAQAEVDRMSDALESMAGWIDVVQSCASCPRPAIPVGVISAEFDAALEGFFGQSGVQLALTYQVYGDRRTLSAGFSGSIGDVASSLFTAMSDALF